MEIKLSGQVSLLAGLANNERESRSLLTIHIMQCVHSRGVSAMLRYHRLFDPFLLTQEVLPRGDVGRISSVSYPDTSRLLLNSHSPLSGVYEGESVSDQRSAESERGTSHPQTRYPVPTASRLQSIPSPCSAPTVSYRTADSAPSTRTASFEASKALPCPSAAPSLRECRVDCPAGRGGYRTAAPKRGRERDARTLRRC